MLQLLKTQAKFHLLIKVRMLKLKLATTHAKVHKVDWPLVFPIYLNCLTEINNVLVFYMILYLADAFIQSDLQFWFKYPKHTSTFWLLGSIHFLTMFEKLAFEHYHFILFYFHGETCSNVVWKWKYLVSFVKTKMSFWLTEKRVSAATSGWGVERRELAKLYCSSISAIYDVRNHQRTV